jgi:MoaA/NifB/PqqE/SkfB family radical SAM enzyme
MVTETRQDAPSVALDSLDTVWFQVSGTLCNLACSHCLVSASPTNRTHDHMTLDSIRGSLEEAAALGAREYYFTGGEPFLNPEMEAIVEASLGFGPTTVLTNGLLLDAGRSERLRAISDASDYSLDLRVSLDGWDAGSNDPIRGQGSFARVLKGVGNLVAVGINPVLTVTEVCEGIARDEGKTKFLEMLRDLGIDKPRLKVLPLFKIGAESDRDTGYADWQRLREGDDAGAGWGHLQCSSCRMVTSRGVWVCPILVNEPEGKMGEALVDTLESYPLRHQACWTCHVQGASCRT